MIIKKSIRTNSHDELIDITGIVSKEIRQQNIQDGNVIVFIPHTTAGITINENADPSVKRDILYGLKSFDFESLNFHHAEGNSPSHLKASLMGSSVNIIIENGNMLLGTWQGIYFCEFDGPRNRKIYIKF